MGDSSEGADMDHATRTTCRGERPEAARAPGPSGRQPIADVGDQLLGARPRVRPQPSKRWTAVTSAAVAALVLSGCGVAAVGGAGEEDGAGSGYTSGDGSVSVWEPDDRGESVRLVGDDYAGNPVDSGAWIGDVVVVNTWYASCPPCRAEAPDLVAAANDYADRGVHFVGVNATDEAGAAQAFDRTFEVPYPSIQDADGSALSSLQGHVPIQAVPTTLIVDRQGRVAARVLGLADPIILRELIDSALQEPAA